MSKNLPQYITGKFAVGTERFSFFDEERKEVLGGAEGCRRVSVRVYYPTEKGAVSGLSRADIFSQEKLSAVKKTFRLKKVPDELLKADFYLNAPRAKGKFPLIMFSHGYNSYVEANSFLCCELASNGYIVASVGHAFEAAGNDYDDGSFDCFDKNINKIMYKSIPKAILSQFKLMRAKLSHEEAAKRFDEFQRANSPYIMGRVCEWGKDILSAASRMKTRYADSLDLSRGIAAAGHSLGGAAAYWLCRNSDEVSCGINIDGGIFGEYSGASMSKPFLQVSCEDNLYAETLPLLNKEAPVELVMFENMKHIGFTDIKFFSNAKSMVGTLDGCEMHRRLADSSLSFLKKYL